MSATTELMESTSDCRKTVLVIINFTHLKHTHISPERQLKKHICELFQLESPIPVSVYQQLQASFSYLVICLMYILLKACEPELIIA